MRDDIINTNNEIKNKMKNYKFNVNYEKISNLIKSINNIKNENISIKESFSEFNTRF